MQPGGEDMAVKQELKLLYENNEVDILFFQNKIGIIGAFQFLFSIWNILAVSKLKKKLKKFKPDIIHVHNWHFACGPIIFRIARNLGIPVVHTLHNYRLLCPSTILLYEDKLFTESLSVSFPWSAIKKKLYRNSALQTFWLAFIVWFHKRIGTWNMVGCYVVLTKLTRQFFLNSTFGIKYEKFCIKPNFAINIPYEYFPRGNSFLFIGRLSHEKGLMLLLEVFSKTNYPLEIAGDGPLKNEVIKASATYGNIKYLGILDQKSVVQSLRACTALVFPSTCYETFGLVIIEAFSLGCPVIASNTGAPSEIVQAGENGLHFEAGNPTALAQVLQHWQNLPENEKAGFRQNARLSYEAHYTPKKNLDQLVAIYQQVIDEKKAS